MRGGPRPDHRLTWRRFESLVRERPVRIRFETPGKGLVQRAGTGEILGVRALRHGAAYHVKARRAVVLTCGGFENNQEMVRNYLPGLPWCYTSGSPFNEGDGIAMALGVGADLWHMNNFAGLSMALKVPEVPTTFSMQALHFAKRFPGGMVVVGPDARRFADEKLKSRHGKIPMHGTWKPMPVPVPMLMVFDETLMRAGPLYDKTPRHGWTQIIERYDWSEDNRTELARGWIRSAATIEALARAVGLDSRALAETVARWNRGCEAGGDPEFGRTLMLAPIVTPPYYAVALSPSMLNTQGGPRRNEKAQVVRPDGTPIPRLYSAGELGSIYSNLYQGTGNIGECLAFGRIAGRHAIEEAPWG